MLTLLATFSKTLLQGIDPKPGAPISPRRPPEKGPPWMLTLLATFSARLLHGIDPKPGTPISHRRPPEKGRAWMLTLLATISARLRHGIDPKPFLEADAPEMPRECPAAALLRATARPLPRPHLATSCCTSQPLFSASSACSTPFTTEDHTHFQRAMTRANTGLRCTIVHPKSFEYRLGNCRR